MTHADTFDEFALRKQMKSLSVSELPPHDPETGEVLEEASA